MSSAVKKNRLSIFASRLLGRHETKVRFVVVGAWNTLFAYLVFCLLDTILTLVVSKRYYAYMLAMFFGQVIGITHAFILHKYVTFGSGVKGRGVIGEFARFVTTYGFTFSLNMLSLPFFVELLGVPPKIAGALLIPVCAIITYFGHSRFSFKYGRHKKAQGLPH